MKILVAEYAVGAGEGGTILLEGRAMLDVLVRSFTVSGHTAVYPTSGPLLPAGRAVKTADFEHAVETLARQCDAGLVVAPDELLGDLTALVEENTINLGCPSGSVRLCADKLATSQVLAAAGINAPKTVTASDKGSFAPGEKIVVKPRWGCASEHTTLVEYNSTTSLPADFVATGYIEGEHLSASLIAADRTLLLSVNRQNIRISGGNIQYDGGTVGIDSGRNREMFETAALAAAKLGCRGYVGVDIVLSEEPWVIDVNPRPTTSIIGLDRVMDARLGELILGARFGGLPENVSLNDEFTFTKSDLAASGPL